MTTKLISGKALQLLRRYDKRPESQRASLLDDVKFFFFSCFIHTFSFFQCFEGLLFIASNAMMSILDLVGYVMT